MIKKNALIVSQPVKAKDAARQVDNKASENMKEIIVGARHIQETDELDFLCMHFELISDSIYKLVKELDMSKPVYRHRQHCPMADQDRGANWLSKEEAIVNPYFGESMLGCGEVQRKIN